MLVIQLHAERFIAVGHPNGSSPPENIAIDAVELLLGDGAATVIRDGDIVQYGAEPVGAITLFEPDNTKSRVKA
jgi:hypothetical protein